MFFPFLTGTSSGDVTQHLHEILAFTNIEAGQETFAPAVNSLDCESSSVPTKFTAQQTTPEILVGGSSALSHQFLDDPEAQKNSDLAHPGSGYFSPHIH